MDDCRSDCVLVSEAAVAALASKLVAILFGNHHSGNCFMDDSRSLNENVSSEARLFVANSWSVDCNVVSLAAVNHCRSVDSNVTSLAAVANSWSVDCNVVSLAAVNHCRSVDSNVTSLAAVANSWSVDCNVVSLAALSGRSSSARRSSTASLEQSWLVDSGQVEGFHLTINGNGHNDARNSKDSY
jgi:hypothetical protein